MAIFREFQHTGRNRAAEDRRRHRELVEDSIKKNIGEIIAEESIIGSHRDKKIKIPIRGIKEYRFIFGKNQGGVGSGTGNEKRGDKVGTDPAQGKGSGQGAGNEEGEDIYETEVTIEELINYLFDELKLPNMEKKKLMNILSESYFKKRGYQTKGIPPRLSKKKTIIEKIKRNKARQRDMNDEEKKKFQEERFPLREEDLRYYRIKEEQRKESNAVIFCIMDTSGSMDQTKKYLARSFYFLLYQYIKYNYENVVVIFISHTTTAKEVSENEFFHRGESGGTFISSGYEKAMEIIKQRYDPSHWNIYAFHCTDGENWSEDNNRAVEWGKKLCSVSNLFGYAEIKIGYYTTRTHEILENNLDKKRFTIVRMRKKEDVWPAVKKILEKE